MTLTTSYFADEEDMLSALGLCIPSVARLLPSRIRQLGRHHSCGYLKNICPKHICLKSEQGLYVRKIKSAQLLLVRNLNKKRSQNFSFIKKPPALKGKRLNNTLFFIYSGKHQKYTKKSYVMKIFLIRNDVNQMF